MGAIFPATWIRLLTRAGDLLAPACCGICGAIPAEGRRAICADCLARLEAEKYAACEQCAVALPAPAARCGACLAKTDYPLRGVTALFRYQNHGRNGGQDTGQNGGQGPVKDVGRRVVLKLKKDHDGILAASLAEVWIERARGLEAIELVTCIPQRPRFPWEEKNVGPARLAEAIASRLGKPAVVGALRARKWMRRQHDLNVRQRLRNVRRAFRVAREQDIKGRAILVVDDVMTSGATLCSAAATLLEAGAREVWGAAAARGAAFGGALESQTPTPARNSSVRKSLP